MVANRVGFDGKVASDRNNFRRTAEFCRRMEQEYRLREVQSPRQFQTQEQRQQQRHDSRKEKLRVDIAQTLSRHSTYQGFEQGMKDLGYQVLKGRGSPSSMIRKLGQKVVKSGSPWRPSRKPLLSIPGYSKRWPNWNGCKNRLSPSPQCQDQSPLLNNFLPRQGRNTSTNLRQHTR
ncbi:relaxase/mobilization nuclease domain-containing protein [Paraflavitalea speifideaquila]|uniref:relaxase/mobilization nuclease domain-containing protein n=1 Tax=Paraflavitalea speifideaquila TaxID=3076558 RepID=UPI00331308E6